MTAVETWAAKADREVLLPSGTRIKVRVPAPEALLREQSMPTELRAMVLRYATTGIPASLPDEQLETLLTMQARLAAQALRAIWDETADAWQEVRLTADEIAGLDLPADDLTAIEQIALRQATPNQVTARSRRDLGLIAVAEAARIAEEEAAGTVDAFRPFRSQSGGVGPRPDGADVRPTPLRAHRDRRSGRGAVGR